MSDYISTEDTEAEALKRRLILSGFRFPPRMKTYQTTWQKILSLLTFKRNRFVTVYYETIYGTGI